MPESPTSREPRTRPPSRFPSAAIGDFAVPTLLALLLTWWMTAKGRELAWQAAGYRAEDDSWPIGDRAFWSFLYDFGSYPVIVVCLVAIVVLVLGTRNPRLWAWRRVGWFALSLLLLGPGLVANLWMKENWGRPRPRETTDFGGRHDYETVFGMDFTGVGKSFPCGHATMGFYFVGLAFLLRQRHPAWAAVALVVSLAWGTLIGITRMLQGGHFATDVVWAAWVMVISSAILYRLFRLDRQVLDDPADKKGSAAVPWKVKLLGGGLGILLVALVLMATPYRAPRNFFPIEPPAAEAAIRGSIKVERGDVRIEPSEALTIRGEAWGHGVPTSRIADRWEEEIEEDGTWRFRYHQRYSGYFTEVDQRLRIGVPWERTAFLKLDLGPGVIAMDLPPVQEVVRLELVNRGGEIQLSVPEGTRVWVEAGDTGARVMGVTPGILQTGLPIQPDQEGAASYRVEITGWDESNGEGILMIRQRD